MIEATRADRRCNADQVAAIVAIAAKTTNPDATDVIRRSMRASRGVPGSCKKSWPKIAAKDKRKVEQIRSARACFDQCGRARGKPAAFQFHGQQRQCLGLTAGHDVGAHRDRLAAQDRLRATLDYQRSATGSHHARTIFRLSYRTATTQVSRTRPVRLWAGAISERDRFQGFPFPYTRCRAGWAIGSIDRKDHAIVLEVKGGPAWRWTRIHVRWTCQGKQPFGPGGDWISNGRSLKLIKLTQDSDLDADGSGSASAIIGWNRQTARIILVTGIEAGYRQGAENAPVLQRTNMIPIRRRRRLINTDTMHAFHVHLRVLNARSWTCEGVRVRLAPIAMAPHFSFTIHATDGTGREPARSSCAVARFRTPAFMPVGTAATVKAMKPEAVRATGADIILGNTYHSDAAPRGRAGRAVGRPARVHELAERPILTDSGGYQVMSLCRPCARSPRKAWTFRSHLDGSKPSA